MSRQRLLFVVIITLILFPTLTLACGGFFCANTPIDQSAERIIFTVNKDKTITAIVGISYSGAAEDFSWVVPVPSPPELDVAETASLDLLDMATQVQLTSPPHYCAGLFEYFGGGGGGADFPEMGHVGPYDYAIIHDDDSDEMVRWLRENGYNVTPEMEPLIAVYVEEEMYFLAMKLNQQYEVGDIQPIIMTYESVEPMIPIRLTAVAARPNMPVITWIFGESRYIADNYASPDVDFSRFQAPHQVAGLGDYGALFFWGPMQAYASARSRIQERYNGLAFITEYASSSASLPDPVHDDPLLARLIADYPYVTRLRAQMSPEQMTIDPMFSPAPGAPDVSNIVDLSEWVDPIHYWGCTSRTALNEATLENLPDARTQLDALQLDVAHPADWHPNEFSVGEQLVYAFAPQVVNEARVDAFFAGDDPGPMLLVTHLENTGYMLLYNPLGMLQALGQRDDDASAEERRGYRPRWWPYTIGNSENQTGVGMMLLASPADWEANSTLYQAMLNYADSYQYYHSAEFRHTLFLTYPTDYYIAATSRIEIGYPDGWVEQMTDEQEVIIAPDSAAPLDAAPRLRLIPIENIVAATENYTFDFPNNDATWGSVRNFVVREFGLAEGVDLTPTFDQLGTCDADLPPALPFAHDGRAGFVRIAHRYIVEVSAPEGEFAVFEEPLAAMIDGVVSLGRGCDSFNSG